MVSKVQLNIPQQHSESRDKRSDVFNYKYLKQPHKRRLPTDTRDETNLRIQ